VYLLDICNALAADKSNDLLYFLKCCCVCSNPRNEAAENELDVRNDKFGNLGVDFRSLDDNLFDEVSQTHFELYIC
jgi:hypothetical protein